ncbi:MAG: hypothetical protein C0483_24240 [Pirellula sp.]|nr:hypothetical protein [Pirellula sp.]
MKTRQSFSTPEDFLSQLQTEYAESALEGAPDSEFMARTQADLNALDNTVTYTAEQLRSMAVVGAQLKEHVYGSLAADMAARIVPNIAVGILDTGEANAAIFKSPDGKYAILLNNGLLLLLNKFVKLMIAWEDPGRVIYCNRKPAEELTVGELREFLPELVETYKQYGAPHGAMLKLAPYVVGRQSSLLHLMELFIVCHELGHFLNGDLDNESDFCVVEDRPWLRKFEENKDHAIEYAADATGFQLLQTVLQAIPGNFSPLNGLQAIILLFNLFFLLTEDESPSHPNPRTRSVRIARQFFGESFADALESSYENPELLRALFPKD